MNVVILAGGFGTRISEESHLIPKPMIEVGGEPILWHIMKIYSHYGFSKFIICCGYKAHIIKEFFSNYYTRHSDITFDLSNDNEITIHRSYTEPWKITVVDTGLNTMTGGRIKRIQKYVGDNPFMMTYGDGVSDINIKNLLEFHRSSKRIATLTAIQPGGRFGALDIVDDNRIQGFQEKNIEDGGWINAGFMVLEPQIFDYIEGDDTIFERYPLEALAKEGQLGAYHHYGFWSCMDTLRDKLELERLWESNTPPWKVW